MFKKHRLLGGVLLIFLGGYLIWNNIINSLSRYMQSEVYMALSNVTRVAPQIIVGAIIIAVGAKLIIGKKRECDSDD